MNQEQRILELEEQVKRLESSVNDVTGAFYKNNFTSSQSFNKDCVFNTRLRVPVYSAAPTVGEIGDLIAVSGVLYVCTNATAPATFSKVGSQ